VKPECKLTENSKEVDVRWGVDTGVPFPTGGGKLFWIFK